MICLISKTVPRRFTRATPCCTTVSSPRRSSSSRKKILNILLWGGLDMILLSCKSHHLRFVRPLNSSAFVTSCYHPGRKMPSPSRVLHSLLFLKALYHVCACRRLAVSAISSLSGDQPNKCSFVVQLTNRKYCKHPLPPPPPPIISSFPGSRSEPHANRQAVGPRKRAGFRAARLGNRVQRLARRWSAP